jgi:gliding motility-associated-like protein
MEINGLESVDYRFFQMFDPPELNLQNDTIICEGGAAIIKTPEVPDCLFEWAGYNKPIETIDHDEVLTGILTNNNTYCVSTDNVEITVAAPEEFSLGNDLEFCTGKSIEAVFDGVDVDKFKSFTWDDTQSNSTTRVFDRPGKYSATSIDKNKCIFTDEITVTENPLPQIDLGDNNIICTNTPRTLTCLCPTAVSYVWNTGNNTKSIQPQHEGVYTVTVADKKGCSSTQSIELFTKTPPEISLPADTLLCDGETLPLSVEWFDATSYNWNNDNQTPEYVVSSQGKISATVCNVCGCTTDDMYVKYRFCGEFVFPNIITPNNDGINDYFKIKGLDEYTSGWQIDIYTREGKHVYHSNNYKNEWNAEGLNDGVYFYIFQRDDQKYNGNITVLSRK